MDPQNSPTQPTQAPTNPMPPPPNVAPQQPIFSANTLEHQAPKTANPKKALIVTGVIIALIAASIAGFVFYNANKSKFTIQMYGSDLTPYSVQDVDVRYSLRFRPGATISNKNGITYLISSEGGYQSSFFLMKLEDKSTCDSANPLKMEVDERGVTICQRPDKYVYAGPIEIKGQWYQVNLVSQKQIEEKDAREIFKSVSFN